MKKIILSILALSLIGLAALATQLTIPKPYPHKTIIDIPKKSHAVDILNLLEKKDVIRSKKALKLYFKLSKADQQLKSGTYVIPKGRSPIQIIQILTQESPHQQLIRVTIPEGFSIKKIAKRLDKAGLAKEDDFLRYLKEEAIPTFKGKYPFINTLPINNLEGYLYPDTYFFAKDTSLKKIVATFLKTFNKKIYQTWLQAPAAKGSLKSRFDFHKVLTFSSIIEKEARAQKEMPKIASVYNNRLKKRMRLEADPTVLYALGEPDKKRVLYRDLEVKSPYNTYRNFGLPPGPIASPGIAAFEATLAPQNTPYLYFVADPKTGHHHFSQTFDMHKKRVREMRRKR